MLEINSLCFFKDAWLLTKLRSLWLWTYSLVVWGISADSLRSEASQRTDTAEEDPIKQFEVPRCVILEWPVQQFPRCGNSRAPFTPYCLTLQYLRQPDFYSCFLLELLSDSNTADHGRAQNGDQRHAEASQGNWAADTFWKCHANARNVSTE